MSLPSNDSANGSNQSNDFSEELASDSLKVGLDNQRKDKLSPLTIIALIVCIVLQSSLLPLIVQKLHPTSRFHPSQDQNATAPSSDLMQGLIDIDTQTKAYYALQGQGSSPFLSGLISGSVSSKDPRLTALKLAEKMLRKSPDQPALARRVILLRAETGHEAPLATWLGINGYQIYSPLDAFTIKDAELPQIELAYKSEGDGYALLYSAKNQITPESLIIMRRDFDQGPSRKWWDKILQRQIALRTGDKNAAARDLKTISQGSVTSFVGMSILFFIVGVLCLAGLIMAIVVLTGQFALPAQQPAPGEQNAKLREYGVSERSIVPSNNFGLFTDEVPNIVANKQRRLSVGDLSNLFLIYLLAMEGTQVLFSLFSTPLHKMFATLSWQAVVIADICFEALLTLLIGLIMLAAVFILAKRRGANLGEEIGLNFGWEKISRTVLFGILGWGAALAVVIPVSSAADRLFHTAPSPANPVIPLMMATPAGFASILMYVMVAFIAPVFEEIAFRGLLMNAFKIKFGAPRAILFTGLSFGFMHPVGIAEQVALATLGCGLAWIANRKKSLFPSMIAHAFQNSFVYCALLVSMITAQRPIGC